MKMNLYDHIKKLQDLKWTYDEDILLLQECKDGKSIENIAYTHQRTIANIEAHLSIIASNLLDTGKSIDEVCKIVNLTKNKLVNNIQRIKKKKKNINRISESDILCHLENKLFI